MIVFCIKSFFKSLAFIGIGFFLSGIVAAIGDGFGAHYSAMGLIIETCIVVAIASIAMFFFNSIVYNDRKTVEKGGRKKGTSSAMPWEFYQKFLSKKQVTARRVYITMFLMHGILAVAGMILLVVYYSDLDFLLHSIQDNENAGVIMCVILLTDFTLLQILYPISMIHAVKDATCPQCGCVFSGAEEYDFGHRKDNGTWYTTETYDEHVGTVRAGDTSMDVYRERTAHYKEDYVCESHTTKCCCIYCGYQYDRYKSSINSSGKKRI